MSTLPGTYTNASLNATLTVNAADDATGGFNGTLRVGANSYPVSGVWSANAPAPNAIFYFTGSGNNIAIGGAGASPDFRTFANTTISVSIAQSGGVVTNFTGAFQRS